MVNEAGVRMPAIPNTSIMPGIPGTSPSSNHAKNNAAVAQPRIPTPRRNRLTRPGSWVTFCLDNLDAVR